MSSLRLDHLVIKVESLDVATRDYTALGFTVVPGGEHPAFGSRNALIGLADDTYLELIEFDPAKEAQRHEAATHSASARRVAAWAERAAGLVDWALVPDDINTVIRAAGERGVAIAGPEEGGRVRPDGQRVAWQFGTPDGFDLPFLCADMTPRVRRVPQGEARQHANGARGIQRIVVAVVEPIRATHRYLALLGSLATLSGSPASPSFDLGGLTIVLNEYALTDEEGPIALELRADATIRLGGA